MKILRIENSNGYGFESCIGDKRKKCFNPFIRFGFPISDSDTITAIQNIQFYIGISQHMRFLPLYDLHKKLIIEENNILKRFNFISEKKFIKILNELGFNIYLYEILKSIKDDGFEIVFLEQHILKKEIYKAADIKGWCYIPNKEFNIKSHRKLKKDFFF